MRIDCPSCAASYEVPDTLLAGRKAVRCARCGQQWTPAAAVPQAQVPEPPRPASDRIEPMVSAAPLTPRPPAPPRGLGLAWAASVLVVVAGLGAAVVWRDQIAQVWPPSLRVYVALGLAHNPG